MGFDLGALLRGGAAGVSGYQQGQQQAEQRKQAAQRQALQEALLRSQTDNQRSLAQDRTARQAAAQAQVQVAADEAASATQTLATEADYYRTTFPDRLGNMTDDAVVVRLGKGFQTHKEQASLRQPRAPTREPVDTRNTVTLQQALSRVEKDEEFAGAIYDRLGRDPTYEEMLAEAKRRMGLANSSEAPPPKPQFRAGGFGSTQPTYPGGASYPARPGTEPARTTQPTTFTRGNPYTRP